MPYKDREKRLAYLRRWKAENRPSPSPEPQNDSALPKRGELTFSADGGKVKCHACGRWFGSLNTHLKLHGLDAQSYKEAYDLPRTASLLPPLTAERYRQAAIERDQGAVSAEYLPPPVGRPCGQEARLGVRVSASKARKGVYTHGGEKTNKPRR